MNNFDLGTNSNGMDNPCGSNWTNTRNIDSDGDGVGDNCQVSDCLNVDTDSDGISDCVDLCPSTNNTALHFDGVDDYCKLTSNHPAYNFFATSDFSISAWINPEVGGPAPYPILTKGFHSDQIFAFLHVVNGGIQSVENKLALMMRNPSGGLAYEYTFSESEIAFGIWTHVTVAVKNDEVRFYINGELDNVTNFTFSTRHDLPTALYSGIHFHHPNQDYFKGKIDDLVVWNKEVNSAEIRAFMSSPLSGTEANLVSYFDYNGQVACGNQPGSTSLANVVSMTPGLTLNAFDLNGSCESNWTISRNEDTNGDGVGDSCNGNLYLCAIDQTDSDNDGIQDCLDFVQIVDKLL